MAKDIPAVAGNSMQLAEILSDLDPAAALALVSARPVPASSLAAASAAAGVEEGRGGEEDVDLERAKDLLKLHYEVREAHKRGELEKVLLEARSAVERAVGG